MKKKFNPVITIAIIVAFIVIGGQVGIFIFNIKRPEQESEASNAYFKVTIPAGWKADGEDREECAPSGECWPGEGFYIYPKECTDKDQRIYIFRMVSSISADDLEEDSDSKETFITKGGIKGKVYKRNDIFSWGVLYDEDDTGGYYGANVYFKDKSLISKHEKEIMDILKSLVVNKEQSE